MIKANLLFSCMCLWCHVLENHCHIPCHEKFSLCFLQSFILLTLTLRSLIHFEIFVYSMRIKLHSVACRYPVFPKPFVEKTVLPSLMILVPLLKISPPYIWGFISGLCSMPLVHESVCVPIPHYLYYHSFVLCFEIRKCESTATFFHMFWLFEVPWESIWILLVSAEEHQWDFDRVCIEYVDCFE